MEVLYLYILPGLNFYEYYFKNKPINKEKSQRLFKSNQEQTGKKIPLDYKRRNIKPMALLVLKVIQNVPNSFASKNSV